MAKKEDDGGAQTATSSTPPKLWNGLSKTGNEAFAIGSVPYTPHVRYQPTWSNYNELNVQLSSVAHEAVFASASFIIFRKKNNKRE
jgi:hypothetical protein